MFGNHVNGELSAYCHNELAEEDSRRVAEHLIGCSSCRREFEEVRLGVKLAGQLPRAAAPAALWAEIERALDERPGTVSRQEPPRRRLASSFRWPRLVAACALSLLALAAGLVWYSTREPGGIPQVAVTDETKQTQQRQEPTPQQPQVPDAAQNPPVAENSPQPDTPRPKRPAVNGKPAEAAPTWEVARLAGAPKVGSKHLEGSGRLAVGEWLETDASSRARVNVADIGEVDVGPNSRLRLLNTRSTEHRLALERGRLHAMIDAPPRLFIVETPSATAIDLGCSYTLEVDDVGRTRLHVTSGWVALELKGREAIVPAGAVCVTQPGKGPGTPYFDDASPSFRAALTRLDFQGGGADDLSVVLAEAREYDTLTLWHLLSRLRGADRARVYDRMSSLVPPPQGVTRKGILRLNRAMLELWKQELAWVWFD
ncbi:MAG TPA: FecR domain-containing protein [Pyrinomonadaceae bacterium]|nr:FecR domain-containing protein [Pyrinomonadaceae bacterium]